MPWHEQRLGDKEVGYRKTILDCHLRRFARFGTICIIFKMSKTPMEECHFMPMVFFYNLKKPVFLISSGGKRRDQWYSELINME